MKLILIIIPLMLTISSCEKKVNKKTDFDLYCEFVTKVISDKKYSEQPVEHLKLYSEFRMKVVSKTLKHILISIQKVKKEQRYVAFIKTARKVLKRDDWKCDAYKDYSLKFTK